MVFDTEGLDAATLSAIARASSISKANIYRYFESREAIFLEIMLEELDPWRDEVCAKLAELRGSEDLHAIADTMAHALASRRRLGALMAALASVLEHNVSIDTITKFKSRFSMILHECVPPLRAALPSLSEEQARFFLHCYHMDATGLWPHAHPSEVARRAVMTEPLRHLAIDFEPTLRRHSVLVLRGLLADTQISTSATPETTRVSS